jgi:hypothetical protein
MMASGQKRNYLRPLSSLSWGHTVWSPAVLQPGCCVVRKRPRHRMLTLVNSTAQTPALLLPVFLDVSAALEVFVLPP